MGLSVCPLDTDKVSVTEDGIFCNRKTRTPVFRHKYCIMVGVSGNTTSGLVHYLVETKETNKLSVMEDGILNSAETERF